MSIDFPNDELESLLEQLTLAGLDAAEWDRLRALIADNPAAQRRYLEAIHLREGLTHLLSHEPHGSGAGSAPNVPRVIAQDEAVADSAPSRDSRPLRSSYAPTRRWIPSWAAAAGVAFVAGAAAVAFYQQGWGPTLARREQAPLKTVAPVTASPIPLLQERRRRCGHWGHGARSCLLVAGQ